MSKYAQDTAVESIDGLHNEVKAAFASHKTRNITWRQDQLRSLAFMVQDNEQKFLQAVYQDLGRAHEETVTSEIIPIIHEIKEALENVHKWAKPTKVKTTAAWALSQATITPSPKGPVLIISTWNFPIALTLGPLVGAIAAGCPAIVKPAEQAAATAALYAELFPRYLDQSAYKIVQGAIPQTSRLLELPHSHIFYTGSGNVGRIVATAAAKHLTPVTLELGGKSPAVILDDCNLDVAARRVIWSKATNAGQICIAADYVLCSKAMQPKLVQAFRKALIEFNGSGNDGSLVNNKQYSKLITPQHFNRVSDLLAKTKGTVAIGGGKNEKTNKIDVTVVTDVKPDDALMEGEIFGPILPIVTMDSVDQMIGYINEHDNPLALYVFSGKSSTTKHIFNHTRSGGFVENDTLIQFLVPGLVFGGAGPSGYGQYHGKASFDTFSHQRSSASIPFWLDILLAARYPPYTSAKVKRLSLLTRETVTRSTGKSSIGRLIKGLFGLQ